MGISRLFKTLAFKASLILLMLCLNSCFIGKSIESGKARSEFTEENKAIPPTFGKENTVLLCVLQGRSSYDKYLKNAALKNYKGDVVFINSLDISSAKYSDKNIYRYVFDYVGGSTSTTMWSDGLSASTTFKRFYVADRLENKRYESGAEFVYFANAMKVYFRNLEIKRLTHKQM